MNWLIDRLQFLGEWGISYIAAYGKAGLMLFYAVFTLPRKKAAFYLLIREIYKLGVLSLSIIIVSSAFIGMVLALQGYTILRDFGSESAVGQLIALSLLRELGPVVTALLFAGRAGSAVSAEIALMKTTEQLSSMEMMGVDPFKHIIAPRLWAGLISMPILALLFNLIGIWAGGYVTIEWLGVYSGSYWGNMQQVVDLQEDIFNGMIKSVVFAFAVIWIAVFQGYNAAPTSEGIGISTTRTVVHSSLAVLGLDFLLTALMFGDF